MAFKKKLQLSRTEGKMCIYIETKSASINVTTRSHEATVPHINSHTHC